MTKLPVDRPYHQAPSAWWPPIRIAARSLALAAYTLVPGYAAFIRSPRVGTSMLRGETPWSGSPQQ